MEKVGKTYPSGILNPDYVEALFDELIGPDQEKLLGKLMAKLRMVPDDKVKDMVECFDLKEILEQYTDSDVRYALEDLDRLDGFLTGVPTSDLVDCIDEMDIPDYYTLDEILPFYDDEAVLEYAVKNCSDSDAVKRMVVKEMTDDEITEEYKRRS